MYTLETSRSRSGAAMATVGSCTYVFGGAAGGENADSYGDMFCVDCKASSTISSLINCYTQSGCGCGRV